MINVNQAEFRSGFAKWLTEQGQVALRTYRGLCAEVFGYIVEETPQYTGESVSNWTLASNSPVYSTHTGQKERWLAAGKRGKRTPYNKLGFHTSPSGPGANHLAMGIAKSNMRDGLKTIKSITDRVFITNATQWDGDMDVRALESPPGGWLRAVNDPGGMMRRSLSYTASEYAVLDELKLAKLSGMAV